MAPRKTVGTRKVPAVDVFGLRVGIDSAANRSQVFGITRAGEGAARMRDHPAYDAVHSVWIAKSGPRWVPKSRWKVQADFHKPIVLEHPVAKRTLISAGLIKSARPQNPSGKLFRGKQLELLVKLLVKANPHQASALRGALQP